MHRKGLLIKSWEKGQMKMKSKKMFKGLTRDRLRCSLSSREVVEVKEVKEVQEGFQEGIEVRHLEEVEIDLRVGRHLEEIEGQAGHLIEAQVEEGRIEEDRHSVIEVDQHLEIEGEAEEATEDGEEVVKEDVVEEVIEVVVEEVIEVAEEVVIEAEADLPSEEVEESLEEDPSAVNDF